eukprot:TRINITY_DN24298_c0_g1_i2.p1 TRINITY_DN24298_c0_g1~~TRINITY_DN24298_c0_g1_i2.p1  ORF type:complete len:348 (+),score=81.08 TRINITY_DN24298_c0_g1_i2:71-1114(+)
MAMPLSPGAELPRAKRRRRRRMLEALALDNSAPRPATRRELDPEPIVWATADWQWFRSLLGAVRMQRSVLKHLWITRCGLRPDSALDIMYALDLPCNQALETIDLSHNPLGYGVVNLFTAVNGVQGSRVIAVGVRGCGDAAEASAQLLKSRCRENPILVDARVRGDYVADVRTHVHESRVLLSGPIEASSSFWDGVAEALSSEVAKGSSPDVGTTLQLDPACCPLGMQLRKGPFEDAAAAGNVPPNGEVGIVSGTITRGFLSVSHKDMKGWLPLSVLVQSDGKHVVATELRDFANYFVGLHSSKMAPAGEEVADMLADEASPLLAAAPQQPSHFAVSVRFCEETAES